MMADPRRVAILISGRGSNMAALVERAEDYHVALVASDRPQAPGLDWARSRDIPTWCWDGKLAGREAFEAELDSVLRRQDVGTIALAGYMRLLSDAFVAGWRGRIVNIHPSLLPAYKGLDTHARALADGATRHGCTVHIVTEALDDGPILASAEVPVLPNDDFASLEARVLAAEHRLYPQALKSFVMSKAVGPT